MADLCSTSDANHQHFFVPAAVWPQGVGMVQSVQLARGEKRAHSCWGEGSLSHHTVLTHFCIIVHKDGWCAWGGPRQFALTRKEGHRELTGNLWEIENAPWNVEAQPRKMRWWRQVKCEEWRVHKGRGEECPIKQANHFSSRIIHWVKKNTLFFNFHFYTYRMELWEKSLTELLS